LKRLLSFLSTWLPVVIWLCIIATESTEGFSAAHTRGMLVHALDWLGYHLNDLQLDHFNHVLRKCGHFIGYATLSMLFWRAWQRSLRARFRENLSALRWRCTFLALLGTLITASLDEWHQSFIPSRTSTPVDVALDMTGAIIAHLILFLVLWYTRRSRGGTPEAYA